MWRSHRDLLHCACLDFKNNADQSTRSMSSAVLRIAHLILLFPSLWRSIPFCRCVFFVRSAFRALTSLILPTKPLPPPPQRLPRLPFAALAAPPLLLRLLTALLASRLWEGAVCRPTYHVPMATLQQGTLPLRHLQAAAVELTTPPNPVLCGPPSRG